MSTIKDLKKIFDNFQKNLNNRLDKLDEDLSSKISLISEESNKISSTNNIICGELKESTIKIKDIVTCRLLEENRRLSNRVTTLEQRVVTIERNMNLNQQNSRKSNLEIDGIPNDILQNNLKKTVTDIINALNIDCIESDIEVVHRLGGNQVPKTTIMKAKRSLIDAIVDKRKDLASVPEKVEFPENTKLFVRNNLCPHMKTLDYNCRLLKKKELIKDTWSFNGILKVLLDNEQIYKISHDVDLYKLFPDFEEFTFDRNFCQNRENDDLGDWVNSFGW